MRVCFVFAAAAAFAGMAVFARAENCGGHGHDEHDGHGHAAEPHAPRKEHGGCDGHDHAHPETCRDGSAHPRQPSCGMSLLGRKVHAGEAARRLMGLKTVKPVRRPLDSSLDLHGRFALMPSARIAAAAPVAGVVSVRVKMHQIVRRGDVLFEVSSPDLRQRKAQIEVLERRLAGYVRTGAKNAELQSELELRKAEFAALAGKAEESGGVVTVKSRIDGIVANLSVAEGSFAELGGAVVELVDPREICLQVRLPAADRRRLKSGMRVLLDGRAGTLELDVIDAFDAHVAFADPDPSWRAGDYARALCIVEPSADGALAVPSEAVVEIGVTPTLFVRDPGDTDQFIAIPAETGRRSGEWTEILNLPSADLDVVVRGQYELKLALGAQTGGGAVRKAAHFHADGTVHEGEH